MIGTSTSNQTRQLIASFKALDVDPPNIVTEASERADRIAEGVRGLGSTQGLAEAVAAAIVNGAEPSTDPEVQRILTCGAIGGIAQEVERVANDQLGETLNAHADTIVNGWRKPFNAAAAALAEVHTILGNLPLEATDEIVRRGGAAAEAWGRARGAVDTIDRITVGWVALATLGRLTLTRHHMILRIADVDPNVWIDDNLTEQKLTPWQMVCAGYPLSLPTPREYLRRTQAVEQARAQRDAAHAQQAHDRQTGRNQAASMIPIGRLGHNG